MEGTPLQYPTIVVPPGWGSQARVRVELRFPVTAIDRLAQVGPVRALASGLRTFCPLVELDPRRVVVRPTKRHQLERAVVEAVRLAQALENALDMDWATWAHQHGGTLERAPDEGLRVIAAELRDNPVLIRLRDDGGALAVEVEARVPGLDRALVVKKRKAARQGGELGDFILDRTILATGVPTDHALRLLSHDGSDAILAVVHGLPHGWIEGGAVHARHVSPTGDPETLVAPLRAAAVALSRALPRP